MKLTTLLSFGSVALFVLAAACAPHVADGTDSAGGALSGAGICSTLDYAHTVTPENFYRKFESDEKAGEFVQKIIAEGQLVGESGPNAKFKEITQDPRILRLIEQVFEGYKRAFPRETEGMTTAPPVAIIETDVVNAFALSPGIVEDASAPADKSPWLFVIHTALLDLGPTDDELSGLIGHELGHLILRTFLPEIRQHVRAVYLSPPNEDGVLGEAAKDDPVVGAHVEEILKRKDRVGGLPELGLNVLEGPRLPPAGSYLTIIDRLVAGAEGDKPSSCAGAKQKMTELAAAQKALLPHVAEGNYVAATPTAEQRATLDRLSTQTGSALEACLPDDGSLIELTAALNNVDPAAIDPANAQHAALVDKMLDAEKQVDADNPSASLIHRILLAQDKIRAEMTSLRNDPKFPIDQIRIYDFEEDADDASVRVLSAVGQDPLGNANLLVKIGLPKELQQKCRDDVAADRPIPYGQFIDPHPATCWRFYHLTQFAKALGQCSAAPSSRAASGTGRASVDDKPASQLVEKGFGTR
jgi:Zn-dependent protease with chaperone function